MKQTLIQFSKIQTAVACKWLIEAIAEIADIYEFEKHDKMECIEKLSIVLAVMRKCHEAAPDIPNLPPEAAEKSAPNNVSNRPASQ